MKNIIEIPVVSKEEAIIAEKGGADRLEISLKSELGGLTPSLNEISEVISNTSLPCTLLIRPSDVSYQLSDEEFANLLHNVEIAKLSKVEGISVGILKDGKIDREKLEKIISIKGNLELTFNHAIDSTYNYEEEIEYLINNENVDKIQTSGSARTMFDGYKRVLPFLEKIRPKFVIGKAINIENIKKLISEGFTGITFQVKGSLIVSDNDSKTLSIDKIKEFVEAAKFEGETGE